ncbi:MAG: hypothetical protein M0P70_04760 [Desulfobulbaceae bacterium]|nr:hypothetical protein [Desulfobulbaceae bacterium]
MNLVSPITYQYHAQSCCHIITIFHAAESLALSTYKSNWLKKDDKHQKTVKKIIL